MVIGAVAMVVMMAIVVIDVTMRSTISKVVPGNIELIGLALVIVFFCAYAYSQTKEEHIRVDVLVGRFSPTVQEAITTSGYFITLGVAIAMVWQCVGKTVFLYSGNIVTGFLRVPEWPFVAITAFFFAIFALALLVTLLKRVAKLHSVCGNKAYLWLFPGIIVVLAIFVFSIWPDFLPSQMSRFTWGAIISLLMFGLMFVGVHIFAVLATVTLVGLSYISGADAAWRILALSAIEVGGEYTWSVVPLFIWMGYLAYHAGFAREIYDVAYKWVGRLPGGLASASVGACAGLAALTGTGQTGVLTMGILGLPEMRRHNYDVKLATGSICAASTIGCLIPPSINFIVYGVLTSTSIGTLFIAGIFPGIMFALMMIITITVMCRLKPSLGPAGPKIPWKDRFVSLKNVWAAVLLVAIVLGGIYTGIFTPTEAGAIGCFGAIVIGLARRRLSFRGFRDSLSEALKLNGVFMIIFIFAIAFSHFLAATHLPRELTNWFISLDLSMYSIIAFIMLLYMILGCLMNAIPAIILTLPFLYPVAFAAGIDPIWFGVLVVVVADLGQITPPIGMNVFAMASIAKDVPMYSIFRGILPFWGLFILQIIILTIFPQISLYLPSLMVK
ncbi:TRAP transporter large permease subunit [Chloroflexota bacterium]